MPGDAKEEPVVGVPHIRSTRGGDDSVKLVESVGGTGRQGSGPPGQGFSKYQKSLPPRFQRQQQVCFVRMFCLQVWKSPIHYIQCLEMTLTVSVC